jgi:hypothetical protein
MLLAKKAVLVIQVQRRRAQPLIKLDNGGNQNPSIEEEQTTQWPKEKGQATISKTPHRKLKIEQHEHHCVNSGAP